MSPDTKAIVDRLIREGDLVRNSGTNSIKSVRVELGKFTDAFTALNTSMAGIKNTVQQQSKIDQLRDEKRFKLEQITDEKERKKYEEQEEKNIKVKQNIETERLKQDRKKQIDDSRRDLKIFGKDGLFTSALKNSFQFLKQVAFYGLIGAVGYEVIAGFLEATFPDTFGPEGTKSLPSTFEGLRKAGTALSMLTKGDWDGLVANVKYLAQPIGTLIGGVAIAKGTEALIGAASTFATNYLTFKALASLILPDAGDVEKAAKTPKFGGTLIRLGIVGAVFAGMVAVMPAITDFIRREFMGLTPEQIAATDPGSDAIGVGGNVATASMVALLAPGGPVIKAFAGIGTFLALQLKNWADSYKNDSKYSNAIEQVILGEGGEVNILEAKLARLEKQKELLSEEEAKALGLDAQIAATRREMGQAKERERDALVAANNAEQERLAQLYTEYDAITMESEGVRFNEQYWKDKKTLGFTINQSREKYQATPAEKAENLARLREEKQAEIDIVLRQMGEASQYAKKMGYTDTTGAVIDEDGNVTSTQTLKRERDARLAAENKEYQRIMVEKYGENFQQFLKNNPDIEFEGSVQEASIAAIKESLVGGPSINYVTNSAPTYANPISLNIGGSRTMTQVMQDFHAGVGMDYCPFPAGASN